MQAREICQELRINLKEIHVDSSVAVAEAAAALTAQGVQAIWVGGDNTVLLALDSVIAAARKARIPVFSAVPMKPNRGTLLDIGTNFYDAGRMTGKMVAEILEGVPRLNTTDLLFSGRDPEMPWNGAGKSKWMLEWHPPIKPWTIHDLRRTAKTLMARARVRPDISERVLGHVIAGVEGTYDRHSYADEKRDALEKLAGVVKIILASDPKVNGSPKKTDRATA